MKTLYLPIKKKWFDMILSGEKKEEYRELKKFYFDRLVNTWEYAGQFKGKLKDLTKFEYARSFDPKEFSKYNLVCLRNGYGNSVPEIVVECLGISIGTAKPEWSDNWQGELFVIKLGKVLEHYHNGKCDCSLNESDPHCTGDCNPNLINN
mgnify:CR=1 FL=1